MKYLFVAPSEIELVVKEEIAEAMSADIDNESGSCEAVIFP